MRNVLPPRDVRLSILPRAAVVAAASTRRPASTQGFGLPSVTPALYSVHLTLLTKKTLHIFVFVSIFAGHPHNVVYQVLVIH